MSPINEPSPPNVTHLQLDLTEKFPIEIGTVSGPNESTEINLQRLNGCTAICIVGEAADGTRFYTALHVYPSDILDHAEQIGSLLLESIQDGWSEDFRILDLVGICEAQSDITPYEYRPVVEQILQRVQTASNCDLTNIQIYEYAVPHIPVLTVPSVDLGRPTVRSNAIGEGAVELL